MDLLSGDLIMRDGVTPADSRALKVHPGLSVLLAGLLLAGLATGCRSPLDALKSRDIEGKPFDRYGAVGPLEGQDELDAAKRDFEIGKFAEAEKAFKKVRKKYKDKPIEEDAMFYIGECQYEQSRFPAAQDSYDELLDKYTSTRYVEPITRRLYHIANTWLGTPKPVSDVELAAYMEGGDDKQFEEVKPPPYAMTLLPNFTNRTRPLFDPEGRSLQCLKSIWLKDPTGPLADDALQMTATYYLRRQDYQQADYYFGILRQEYPQSEFTASAYILGSHVKLATYQGAAYDSKQLEEAKKLAESTVRLYPNLPETPRLREKLSGMTDQTAQRQWERAQLYVRKGKPLSAAVYYKELVQFHPNSQYAKMAEAELEKMRPKTEQEIATDRAKKGFFARLADRGKPTTTPTGDADGEGSDVPTRQRGGDDDEVQTAEVNEDEPQGSSAGNRQPAEIEDEEPAEPEEFRGPSTPLPARPRSRG